MKEDNMEIKKNVFEPSESHGKSSTVNSTFLAFVEKNPWSLNRSSADELLKLNFDAGSLQPWPAFADPHTASQLREAGTAVFDLIRSIPERLFDNDLERLSKYYNIPADTLKVYLEDWNGNHLKTLIGRGDFIFSPSGLKCIEYNVSGGLGGWQVALLEPIYLQTPAVAAYLRESGLKVRNKNLFASLFRHLAVSALDKFTAPAIGYEVNIAIAVMDFDSIKNSFQHVVTTANQIYAGVLSQLDKRLKGEILFCDFHHLHKDDDRLFCRANAKQVHALVEMNHGDDPPWILDVFKSGNLLLYDGPITRVFSDKEIFALLSEHQESDFFNAEEREAIRKYIPWTRRIVHGETCYENGKVTLKDIILSRKNDLVMKPMAGMGGEWVFIGRNTHEAEWRELVRIALRDGGWLIQELIESSTYMFQYGENGMAEHHAVWGLFVFGSQYAGGFLRVMPEKDSHGVINTKQGAEKTVILEIEE